LSTTRGSNRSIRPRRWLASLRRRAAHRALWPRPHRLLIPLPTCRCCPMDPPFPAQSQNAKTNSDKCPANNPRMIRRLDPLGGTRHFGSGPRRRIGARSERVPSSRLKIRCEELELPHPGSSDEELSRGTLRRARVTHAGTRRLKNSATRRNCEDSAPRGAPRILPSRRSWMSCPRYTAGKPPCNTNSGKNL
jgi:hypothetical protein